MDGVFKSIWLLKTLRTLLAGSGFGYSNSSLQDWALVSNLTSLRTLDLSRACITELSKEVEKLIHLRYLNLTQTEIKELPETITNLSNLQTLNLSECGSLGRLPNGFGKLISLRHLQASHSNLEELPNGFCCLHSLQTLVLNGTKFKTLSNNMEKLVGLRHLDISRCALRWLPPGIGKLIALRFLSDFIVSENGCDLEELQDLNNLRGSLVIRNIRGIGNEAHEILKNKKYLKSLHLEFCSSSKDDDLKTLELLEPHPDLGVLKIYSYSGSKFPRWMEFLGSRQRPIMLRRLIIYCCSNLKGLPALGKLQFLEYLCLNDFKSLSPMSLEILEFLDGAVRGLDGDKVETSAPVIAFPNLKELVIMNMTNWEEWVIDTSMNMTIMPCLQILEIGFCPKLKSVPCQLLSSIFLGKISIGDCPKLEFSCLPPYLKELKLFGDDAGSLSKLLPIRSGFHMNVKSLLIQFAKHSTLPLGIPQLTELQTLTIIMCPILAARCRKDGEDWDLISHIPNIIIDHEMIKR